MTAIAIPPAAIRLPCFAVVGCVPRRTPKMNIEKESDVEQRRDVAAGLEHGEGTGTGTVIFARPGRPRRRSRGGGRLFF